MTTADIKALWRTLPLAGENDMLQLDGQIDRAPEVWLAVARFLKEADLDALPLGRNEIGEGAYANVAEYETKRQNVYELHRRYIDVQLLTRGEEVVFVADKEMAREPQGDFNDEGDYILYAEADNARRVKISPREWLILYPSDAHKPCMTTDGEPRPVRKVCVKVPYVS